MPSILPPHARTPESRASSEEVDALVVLARWQIEALNGAGEAELMFCCMHLLRNPAGEGHSGPATVPGIAAAGLATAAGGGAEPGEARIRRLLRMLSRVR